jgi:ribosomal protein S12 methylthiotransferase
LKVHLTSLGCAKNQVDSELMAGMFLERGHTLCDASAEADALVVNTCAFIQPAVEEAIDIILEMARVKTDGRRLIVCGCLPERYRESLAASLPEVDFFFGTGAYHQVITALEADTSGLARNTLPPPEAVRLDQGFAGRIWPRTGFAYLKLAEGCDRRCTYCIIPRLRGVQKSRRPEDIIAEAEALAESGVRELVLISQETSAYGRELTPPENLADLLAGLAERLPSVWFRLLYLHPETVTPELIRTVAARENICPYFDVPIQHASDGVLKRMGRHHGVADLRRLFEAIRHEIPEAALRTTVMTGFPGETEADVKALLAFIKEIEFDHLGVFIYSDDTDIAAHGLSGHVPGHRAEKRWHRLMVAQERISRARNRQRVGRTYAVLLEQRIGDDLFEGRAMFQAPEVDGLIRVVSQAPVVPGDRVAVRITQADEYDLTGKTV